MVFFSFLVFQSRGNSHRCVLASRFCRCSSRSAVLSRVSRSLLCVEWIFEIYSEINVTKLVRRTPFWVAVDEEFLYAQAMTTFVSGDKKAVMKNSNTIVRETFVFLVMRI